MKVLTDSQEVFKVDSTKYIKPTHNEILFYLTVFESYYVL